jgi:hypothetical protein
MKPGIGQHLVGTRRWALLLILFPLCLALFLACDDGGDRTGLNPNYKEPMVWGFLSKDFTLGELTYDKEIDVIDYDGLRMAPIVLLNGGRVSLLGYSPFEYDYGDTFVIPTYQKYEVEVRHYWGTGFCHVVMPGDFNLTSPPDRNYILGKESTLVSTWRASRAAQWYWLSIFAWYDYYDTTGSWDYYEFSLDTLVYDTSIAVPPERIFPPFVGEVIEGDASVTVQAAYGPANEPGDIGNVRGNAVGFVNAVNVPPERYFYVGAPPAARRAPDGRTMLARFKTRLRCRMPLP